MPVSLLKHLDKSYAFDQIANSVFIRIRPSYRGVPNIFQFEISEQNILSSPKDSHL